MQISKAVKRLGVTPVPWAAVITAIVTGKARVYVVPGSSNKNWRTGVGAVDVCEFVQSVLSETREGTVTKDGWLSNQTVAEMLWINESLLLSLAKASESDEAFRRSHGGIPRKGTNQLRQFLRLDVETFAPKYIFVPEVQMRAGIKRARDVRSWLAERNVEVAFELEKQGGLGFMRSLVEALLAKAAH